MPVPLEDAGLETKKDTQPLVGDAAVRLASTKFLKIMTSPTTRCVMCLQPYPSERARSTPDRAVAIFYLVNGPPQGKFNLCANEIRDASQVLRQILKIRKIWVLAGFFVGFR